MELKRTEGIKFANLFQVYNISLKFKVLKIKDLKYVLKDRGSKINLKQ